MTFSAVYTDATQADSSSMNCEVMSMLGIAFNPQELDVSELRSVLNMAYDCYGVWLHFCIYVHAYVFIYGICQVWLPF